ncbi:MAG TPA: alpha/beta fold hydrolase [Chloroflexota bacterium]|nr:alpha/beta fold hydrolase [Chloroflexota bacterium]
MATFVIVHGAWGGAWSWNKYVVPMLRKAGHDVFPVTLTGLGERAHLGTPETDLDTHIQDVCNVLFYEDLHDVILAGHSYGGMVITGVADRMPERLSQLVYLDAAVPSDGQSLADGWPPERRQELLERAQRDPNGWRMTRQAQPPNPPEIADWALARRVDQPLKTFLQPIRLTRGETTLPRAFVYCSADKEPGSPNAERAQRIKADPRWRYFELPTLHNLMYHMPKETVEILISLADR